jgi:hypothetical protein
MDLRCILFKKNCSIVRYTQGFRHNFRMNLTNYATNEKKTSAELHILLAPLQKKQLQASSVT